MEWESGALGSGRNHKTIRSTSDRLMQGKWRVTNQQFSLKLSLISCQMISHERGTFHRYLERHLFTNAR